MDRDEMNDREKVLVGIACATIMLSVSFGAFLMMGDEVVANAGADQTVDVGEIVQFDGGGSENAASFWWNFRDNGWSNSSATPTRVYHTEGVYDVGLVVFGPTGKQNLDTVRITVRNDPPVADAGSNATIYEDEILCFDASNTIDSIIDMPSLTYRWDFGDGYSSSGIAAKHAYTSAGTFTALLSVTDDQGAIGRDTRAATVLNRAPSASIPDVTVDEGTAVVVTAIGNDTASDLNSLRYEWNNGKFGSKTVYTFYDDGLYHPQVTIRDDNNATASAIGDVQVRNIAPITRILSASVKANITLRAAGEKWHDLQMYLYKDGSLAEIFSVYRIPGNPNEQESTISNFTFDMTSDYQASICYTPENDAINGQLQGDTPGWLILSFEDNSIAIQSHNFNVQQKDTWNWTVCPIACLVGHEITFESFVYDSGRDDVTTLWDFGDGTTLERCYQPDNAPLYCTDSVSHAFPSEGGYPIRITARDDDGGIGTFLTEVKIDDHGMTIQNLAPSVSILGSSKSGVEDSSVWCVASARDDQSSDLTYEWHFGDGYSSPGEISPLGNEASHSFAFSGNYITSVIVRDGMNATGVAITEMTIRNVAPQAKVNCSLSNINEGIISLNASSSTDTISDRPSLIYLWDFGDGSETYGQSVRHVYCSPGNFNVSLTVIDNDGETNTSMERIIAPLTQPKITLHGMRAYGNCPELTFWGNGDDVPVDIPGLIYYWDLGDGTNATGQSICHAYAASGSYQIEVYVVDPNGALATARAFVLVVIDSDGDSLEDEDEVAGGTNPQEADSDGDCIIDYWEINTYGTDPTKFDTDDDQANDWYEITYLGYNVDTDHDGFNNTNDSDSDGDGIIDGLDENPLVFDAPDNSTFPVSVTETFTTGIGSYQVTVAMDYLGDPGQDYLPKIDVHFTKPPRLPPNSGLGGAFEISTDSAQLFIAFILIIYPEGLTNGIETESLSLYRYDGSEWNVLEETGVMSGYQVWGKTQIFSPFQIGDSSMYDSDGDGLDDYYEQDRKGRRATNSNPLNPDSDGDGLYDGWRDANGDMVYQENEIKGEQGERFTGVGGWGTRDDRPDSDLDGLWDGWFDINRNHIWDIQDSPGEIGYVDPSGGGRSVGGFHTDYHHWDTDGDTVTDGQDSDPLIDYKIVVEITDIVQIDSIDSDDTEADFFWEIYVSPVESNTLPYDLGSGPLNVGHIQQTWESYPIDVPDNQRYVTLTIILWDTDDGILKYCDISRDAGGGEDAGNDANDVEITYDLWTGSWTGDDRGSSDPNGPGFVSGEEDGSRVENYVVSNDCELRFNIKQVNGGFDGDWLTTWEEANHFYADPRVYDDDNDNLPAWWEEKYDIDGIPWNEIGLNPLLVRTNPDPGPGPNDGEYDFDTDGLVNHEELTYNTDPYFYDLYLEISANWDVPDDYKTKFIYCIKMTSAILYDTTDGTLDFRLVKIYDNYVRWHYADISLHEGVAWNKGSTDPPWPNAGINIPEAFDYYGSGVPIYPDGQEYYSILLHEIGHYIIGLRDEYIGPDGPASCPECLMHTNKHALCTPKNHKADGSTWQDYYHHESCWETFFKGFVGRLFFDLNGDGQRDVLSDMQNILGNYISPQGFDNYLLAPHLTIEEYW